MFQASTAQNYLPYSFSLAMALLALLSLALVLFSFFSKNITLTQAQCLPDQRQALIQLKHGFKTTELHSWNASIDCCIWDGITCDEQTGMVTALNLFDMSISGQLNLALFNLSSLLYLNLAFNNFYNIQLPQTGFERLANLTHLDLSESGFAGQVPFGISSLTNLITLDLSDLFNTLYLHKTGLNTLLRNLTKLQILRLDGVDISLNESEWSNAIFQVGPTIQKLSFAYCGLKGNFPEEIFNLTNLTNLALSGNSMLSGQLPESIGNLQYLSVLYLDDCSFHGEVWPSITNLTKLKHLNFGSNQLTGTIPMSLFSHLSLKSLDLSNNQLSGYLHEFSNESSILGNIYLDNNNLQGQFPIFIFKFRHLQGLGLASNNFNGTLNLDVIKYNKKLEFLDLSNNKLSIIEGKNHNKSFYSSFPQILSLGMASSNLKKVPSFLRYQTYVVMLDLSNNKIDGVIPNWLWKNEDIGLLNLSHNFFTKIERGSHFSSLDSLFLLDIHSNRISGPVPLLPPGIKYIDCSSNYFFSLPAYFGSNPVYLSFSNNSLTGEIPLSICSASWPTVSDPSSIQVIDLPLLQLLDLSYNNLTGTIPPCLLEDAEFRAVINLKSNQLSGPLPQNISQGCQFRAIDLSGNGINGSLPQSLMNCNNLEVFDIGNNQIVDIFPVWLGNLKNLRVLILRSNQFYGTISNMEVKTKTSMTFFPTLMVFDLSSNRFTGIIPKIVFQNLKAMVINSYSSTFQFGGLNYSHYDIFNNSHYYYQNSITVISKGQEMEIKNSLSIFSSLDLSKNEFSGQIPEEIGLLKSLHVLNLSHNALTGTIPAKFGYLEQLESLDLSSNQLSGLIPQELTSLTFLASLNLSYNNLDGEIPEAHQFSTFLNASYLGNPGLCGNPLSRKCAESPSDHGFNNGLPSMSSTYIIELSVSIGLGLAVGFVSIIWATVSWENGRKWFNFIIDKFYFKHFY